MESLATAIPIIELLVPETDELNLYCLLRGSGFKLACWQRLTSVLALCFRIVSFLEGLFEQLRDTL